jgi:hypothetical protein
VTNKNTGETSHMYLKGCAKTCDKNDVPVCRDGHDVEGNPVTCDVNCCTGDYCNAGSGLVTNIILPAVCAVISILFPSTH